MPILTHLSQFLGSHSHLSRATLIQWQNDRLVSTKGQAVVIHLVFAASPIVSYVLKPMNGYSEIGERTVGPLGNMNSPVLKPSLARIITEFDCKKKKIFVNSTSVLPSTKPISMNQPVEIN